LVFVIGFGDELGKHTRDQIARRGCPQVLWTHHGP